MTNHLSAILMGVVRHAVNRSAAASSGFMGSSWSLPHAASWIQFLRSEESVSDNQEGVNIEFSNYNIAARYHLSDGGAISGSPLSPWSPAGPGAACCLLICSTYSRSC